MGWINNNYLRNLSNKSSAEIMVRMLDVNGDGTGVKNAMADYSTTSTDFYIQPPLGEVYNITRLLIEVVDSGSFDSGSYGNGIILTNGIKVIISKNGIENDITDGVPIKKNTDWNRLCGIDVVISSYGSGNETLNGRFTFSKLGQEVELTSNDKIIVRLNDSFTGLIGHHFIVQGYKK